MTLPMMALPVKAFTNNHIDCDFINDYISNGDAPNDDITTDNILMILVITVLTMMT